MALKPCRECGAKVSSSAEICPHCGVRSPAATNPILAESTARTESKGCAKPIGIFLLLILGVAIITSLAGNEGKNSSPCRSDWTKCTDNADLANNYSGWINVKTDCQIEAEKRAKYGSPKWPWLSFGSFYTGTNYVKTGIAVAIENDAQFQNGFGAMVHSTVICTYDLRAARVTNVSILGH